MGTILVGLKKPLKNDGPRDRPRRRCGEARGFRTVLGRVGARNCPASRAVPRSARWRGAPAVRDRGTRRGDQRAPPAVFSLSMLARGRSATCRLPRATGRRGSVLATVREALSDVDVKARRLLLTVVLPPPLCLKIWQGRQLVSCTCGIELCAISARVQLSRRRPGRPRRIPAICASLAAYLPSYEFFLASLKIRVVSATQRLGSHTPTET